MSKYGDTKSARSIMLVELKKLIEANPLFREKLVFPTLKASRLRTLINQRYGLCFGNAFFSSLFISDLMPSVFLKIGFPYIDYHV